MDTTTWTQPSQSTRSGHVGQSQFVFSCGQISSENKKKCKQSIRRIGYRISAYRKLGPVRTPNAGGLRAKAALCIPTTPSRARPNAASHLLRSSLCFSNAD